MSGGGDWLSLLSVARKANVLALGEEIAARAALDHRARLILLAEDAGESTFRRALRLEGENLPVIAVPADKGTLGRAVGRSSAAVIAVCDVGFAAGICEKLAPLVPEAADAAGELCRRRDKAQRRQEETRRLGKKSRRHAS